MKSLTRSDPDLTEGALVESKNQEYRREHAVYAWNQWLTLCGNRPPLLDGYPDMTKSMVVPEEAVAEAHVKLVECEECRRKMRVLP